VIPGIDAGATDASFQRSGKSRRVVTEDIAYGLLRCRAAFGTQARADVLFLLASTPDNVRGWMADALARSAGYTKSAVREALDRLAEAGIVRRTRVGNADWFALAQPERVIAFVGPVATAPVDTIEIPTVLRRLIDASHILDGDDSPAAFVPARARLEPVDRALGDMHAQLPRPTHDFEVGRRELEAMIGGLADRIGDPSRPLWPW
jgi:DNA-binding transcriptional ArsR family regulator